MTHTFRLKPEEACYTLQIECQSDIQTVSLRSDIGLDILDGDDTSTADVIKSLELFPNDGTGSELLVTYRFQEKSKRFAVNMRTVEGAPGTIK